METVLGSARAIAQTGAPGSRTNALIGALEVACGAILRYGLVAILVYFGTFKFTATEAQAIMPLIANSPFLGWLYAVLPVQAVSSLIGATELLAAALLAARPWAPRLSAIGAVLAIGTFLTTLSFLATTPGVWARVPDFILPVPSGPGGFLLKDVFLLGAAVWCLREALGSIRRG